MLNNEAQNRPDRGGGARPRRASATRSTPRDTSATARLTSSRTASSVAQSLPRDTSTTAQSSSSRTARTSASSMPRGGCVVRAREGCGRPYLEIRTTAPATMHQRPPVCASTPLWWPRPRAGAWRASWSSRERTLKCGAWPRASECGRFAAGFFLPHAISLLIT